jgi:hypothetical protein
MKSHAFAKQVPRGKLLSLLCVVLGPGLDYKARIFANLFRYHGASENSCLHWPQAIGSVVATSLTLERWHVGLI